MHQKIIVGAITGLVILASSVFAYLYFTSDSTELNTQKVIIDESFMDLPILHYGIPLQDYQVIEGKVKRNQNLSEILGAYNVPYEDLHVLAARSKDVYDVRKLKSGAKYSIFHTRDTSQTAAHFVFEPNSTEYVTYHLQDSIHASLTQKPMYLRKRSIAAEINSSLYNAVLDNDGSPLLVNKLVDVFAWQVDFFRIAKGDKFKLLFEEEVVDNKVVGIRNIEGAYFDHLGKDYYAIPFQVSDKVDFYDEDGNSLRKAFLRAPLNFTRISSRYSLRRFHPVQKRYKAHLGTDYAAPRGTPIRTVGDGVVLEARYKGGNGNYVKIKHNSNYTTQYLHMSRIAKGMRPGARVTQGQTIGYVGSTGLANGPHLCFRFWKNGRQVDALKVELPSTEGIKEEQMSVFEDTSKKIIAQLDTLSYNPNQKMLADIPKKEEELSN